MDQQADNMNNSNTIDPSDRVAVGASDNKAKSYTFPEGTEKVCKFDLPDRETYEEIVIPDTVTEIGEEVFKGCKSLRKVTLSKKLVSIQAKAFSGCESLIRPTIPDTVTIIGDEAFRDCKSIGSIYLPKSISLIGKNAFLRCKSLKKITFPMYESGKRIVIRSGAFSQCESLESIKIPESVSIIEEMMISSDFSNVSRLMKLRSILISATSKSRKVAKDEYPVPKSSMEVFTLWAFK